MKLSKKAERTAPFPSIAKSRFLTITLSRFRHLKERHQEKHLPPPPFNVAQLRCHLLDVMGERYDGAFKCPFCGRVCDISEVEFDHMVPLSRGGGLGLDNIGAPCAKCNSAKGEATAQEWTLFMEFLERVIPLARPDILHRLATYGKLVSGKRKAEILAKIGGQMLAKKPRVHRSFR
jgi:HNH endonuclease